jgi:hypothetical protein
MVRSTVDLDVSVLDELKARAKAEHKSVGRLMSELLPLTMKWHAPSPPPIRWQSQPMGAVVDLEDKEAVAALLERYP